MPTGLKPGAIRSTGFLSKPVMASGSSTVPGARNASASSALWTADVVSAAVLMDANEGMTVTPFRAWEGAREGRDRLGFRALHRARVDAVRGGDEVDRVGRVGDVGGHHLDL